MIVIVLQWQSYTDCYITLEGLGYVGSYLPDNRHCLCAKKAPLLSHVQVVVLDSG